MGDSFREKLLTSPFTITDEDIIEASFGVSTNTTTPTSHITPTITGGSVAANTVAVNAGFGIYNLSNTTIGSAAPVNSIYFNGPHGELISLGNAPRQQFRETTDFIGYLHAAADRLNVDFYENTDCDLTEWGFPKETKKQYRYSANVMCLNKNEDRLLEGRFSNYVSRPPSDHSISCWTTKSDITEIVEWIHYNITSKWSISEIKTNHTSFQFVFVIEDKIEAAHFHMRWSV
jgi:hypothetical protein